MGYLNEYIDKNMSSQDYLQELMNLIKQYNQIRERFLYLYVADWSKQVPDADLNQKDYYTICDMLCDRDDINNIDFYIETPGGSGEAAEEIIKFLRNNFSSVSFVVSGEAKSAGTITVLSGDEILMTQTASLGPIDAQVGIGRSRVSAYDYMEWVEEKQLEAEKTHNLNPFDAIIIAQINPGEIKHVHNSLEYAKDIVIDNLVKYKFKNWNYTETNGILVTEEIKKMRAKQIAKDLANHSRWRSHGRSLKREDLEAIGLRVTKVEDDKELCDIVCRIQTVCRLLFESTTIYKIFAHQDLKVFRHATSKNDARVKPSPDIVEFRVDCPKCGKRYELYAKFVENNKIDEDMKSDGKIKCPSDKKFRCDCGYELDLSGIINNAEMQIGKKIIA